METHSKRRPYVCDICNKAFPYRCNLKRHGVVHTQQKLYNCFICNAGFTQKSNLNRHMILHFGVKRFTCIICNRKFSQKINLKMHLATHKGDRPFSCHVCPRKFITKQNLQDHVLRHHSNVQTYVCGICNEGYLDVNKYNRHVLRHNKQNSESDTYNHSVSCDASSQVDETNTCVDSNSSIVYSLESDDDTYLIHCADTNDSEPSPEYSEDRALQPEYSEDDSREGNSYSEDTSKVHVEYCDKDYSENTEPREEMRPGVGGGNTKVRVVNPNRSERRFVDCDVTDVCHEYYTASNTCSFCGKIFSTKSGMLLHMQTHTKLKPYQCELCSKTFSNPSNYRRHLLVHNNVKPFWCSFCKKRFRQKSNLEIHLATHIRKCKSVPETEGEYMYYCEECSDLVTRSEWENHKLIHEEETVILVIG